MLFDLEADAPSDEPGRAARGRRSACRPSSRCSAAGSLGLPRQPLRALQSAAAGARRAARHPGRRDDARACRSCSAAGPGAGARSAARRTTELVDVRASRAPKTRFNGRVAPHRRFAFGSLPLDDVKALKNELGIKVNDVVVALVRDRGARLAARARRAARRAARGAGPGVRAHGGGARDVRQQGHRDDPADPDRRRRPARAAAARARGAQRGARARRRGCPRA